MKLQLTTLFALFILQLSFNIPLAHSSSPPAPVPQTGQTTCYDAVGTTITCTGTGEDGELRMGVAWPNPRFVDNGDQTVSDKLTGLIWSKDANPAAGTKTWQQALDYIKTLNSQSYQGHNDWRLPNINELKSLINQGQSSSATWLNTQGVTNVQSDVYWSGSTNAGYTNLDWVVSMHDGVVGSYAKTGAYYVWPVSSGQSGPFGSLAISKTGQTECYGASGAARACSGTGEDGELQIGAVWPSPRFAANSDQTVTDTLTGLVWSRDADPANAYKTWQQALDYIKTLNSQSYLGHNDWRLPNINELTSLFNRGQSSPDMWLNEQGFSSVQLDVYWSGSNGGPNAWVVMMYYGNVYKNDKANSQHVWPVRSGQSGPFGSLTLSPASATFPATTTGTSSSPATFTLNNGGTASVAISATTISGTDNAQYKVVTGGATPCASLTPTLAAGVSCTVNVTFAPTSAGTKNATLQVTSNDAVNPTLQNSLTGISTLTSYAINSSTTGTGGSISCTTPITQGSTSTCTISPATGYSIATLTDNGADVKGQVSGSSYSIANVTTDHTVTASFADSAAPVISGFNLPPTATSLTVSISTFTVSDNSGSVAAYCLTETNNSAGCSWTSSKPASYPFTSAGTRPLYAFAKDGADNISTFASSTTTITLPDNVAPQVTAFSIPPTATSATVNIISLTATDNIGIANYCLTESNNTSNCNWTTTKPVSYPFTSIPQGQATNKTLYAFVKDTAGNLSASFTGANVTITIPDTTGPVISAFNLPPTASNLTVSISTFTVSDNSGSVASYCLSETNNSAGCNWTTTKPTSYPFASAGAKTLYTFAKDWAGNISTVASSSTTITLPDSEKPVMTAFGATAPATGLTATITVLTATDNVGVAAWCLTETNSSSGCSWQPSKPTNYTFTSDGSKTLYAWAKDAVGNISNSLSTTVTITTPPIIFSTVTLTDATKGTAYSAIISANGGIGTISYSLASGTLPAGLNLSSTGTLSGTPTARVTSASFTIAATDSGGHTASQNFTIRVIDPNYRKLVIVAADQSFTWQVPKNVQTSSIYVKVVDDNGNDANVTTDTKVNITSNSTSGRFSDGTIQSGGNTFTLTISAGYNLTEVFYTDSTTGVLTLTTSGKVGTSSSSWDSGTHTITVTSPNLKTAALTANLSSTTYGQPMTVTGTFTDASTRAAVPGESICLVLTSPSQTQIAEACTTTASNGSYSQIITNIDQAGSWSVTASFNGDTTYNAVTATVPFTVVKADTSILLTLDASNISTNGTVTATGKASSPTATNLQNIAIAVDFIDPDTVTHTVAATIIDTLGHYSAKYSQFTKEGIWQVKARIVSNTNYNTSETSLKDVTVANAAGYAILIEGSNNGQYQANYTASLDDIRKKLISRSLTEYAIQYLSYEGTGHVGVDAVTTKANIQNAITVWALNKMQQYGVAPLYIIMMDHGGQGGKFYIQQPGDPIGSPQYITPDDLNGWITTLENQIKTTLVKDLSTVVINGSCYSGSFIPALSKQNRVIITSSTASEQSVQGPSFNPLVYGEYFIYYLFNSLASGGTVSNAFTYAAGLTQQKMQCSSTACLLNGVGMGDNAAQHPLMDDSGDGVGSPINIIGQKDGLTAAKMVLGLGSNASGLQWQAAMPTTKVSLGTSSVTAWATIDLASTGSSWIEIRRPDYVVPDSGGSGQVVMNLPVISGTPNQATGRYEYVIQPDLTKGFSGLDIAGTYTIYYYATDSNDEIIQPLVGTLYVENPDNRAPSAFIMNTPAAGAVMDSSLMLFTWNETTDPDNDPVTYTLKIYDDNSNTKGSELKRYELIPQGAYVLDGSVEKKADGATPLFTSGNYYWWEVLAVDNKGATTSGGVNRFQTTFTNGLPGIIKGYLRNSVTGAAIAGATITVGNSTAKTLSNGVFLMIVQPGSYSISASATGYQTKNVNNLIATSGTISDASMTLTAATTTTKPGDCDGIGGVTIAEVQSAINMFLGLKSPLACVDIDGNNSVSIAEVQKVINSFLGL